MTACLDLNGRRKTRVRLVAETLQHSLEDLKILVVNYNNTGLHVSKTLYMAKFSSTLIFMYMYMYKVQRQKAFEILVNVVVPIYMYTGNCV